MDSPPKRITRSRAAKAGEPTTRTTKIMTAAAKAKTAGPAPPSSAATAARSVSAKRKTRADEDDEDEDDEDETQRTEVATRRARGRPRKVVEPEADNAAKGTTKPRAVRKTTEGPAPVKAPRGRPRKVAVEASAEKDGVTEDSSRKTTRGRAGTTSRADARPPVKKTVKFQEPEDKDKENVKPAPSKAPPAGLRGRPARRGGETSTARCSKATKTERKKPLSPKKVTQMPLPRGDSSEDELAGNDFTPVKPNSRPAGASGKKTQQHQPQQEIADEADTTQEVNAAVLDSLEPENAGLGSPARRPPPSPFKESMRSPAKRTGAIQLPGSAMKSAGQPTQVGQTSPLKSSLLMTPAKRPMSPIKGLNFGSALKSDNNTSVMKASLLQSPAKRAVPGLKPLMESRQEHENASGSPKMKPLVAATPANTKPGRPSEKLMDEENGERPNGNQTEDVFSSAPLESLNFPGRMSAVLPRHVDPLENEEADIVEDQGEQVHIPEEEPQSVQEQELSAYAIDAEPLEGVTDPMAVDDAEPVAEDGTATPPQTPPKSKTPMFQLRQKDLDPYHGIESESEDELSSPSKRFSQSPSPKKSRRVTLGLSSLADQFGAWSSTNPAEAESAETTVQGTTATVVQEAQIISTEATSESADEVPVENNFFNDEMSARLNVSPAKPASTGKISEIAPLEEPEFADVMLTDEDMALAEEANEMSLMEPKQVQQTVQAGSFDDNMSDTSQEYGDENQIPIDPALLGRDVQEPVTPIRPLVRMFNTTTKVPLKAADESTPSPLKKRSMSASRVPRRPDVLPRSATVISYSPMKERRQSFMGQEEEEELADSAPVTPVKADSWSTMGTPARTPRRDTDPALLRGAVVFVDVHTSEGADASGIFVELLTQMGARCLKSWPWNPSSPTNGDSSRIGITHVVYKDGGKRTLEKVREANGVVQCVGVSWVLE